MISDLLSLESNYTKEEKKIILSFLLNCKINDLYLITEIDTKIEKKYKKMIKSDLPVQYLLGRAHFLDFEFFVDKNVLIPRFETETLVLNTNLLINKYFGDDVNIIDLGTGSGVIAISLKKLNSNYHVSAVDISKKALKIAEKNAKLNNCFIKFIQGDMLNNIKNKYDVLISNPPYLTSKDKIEKKVLKYEPHLALFASNNGLEYYEKILKDAARVLNKKSIIAFEIGNNEKDRVVFLANKYLENPKIITEKDLNGFDRYIYILNNFE